jgi:S-formylglutathione hydrolase
VRGSWHRKQIGTRSAEVFELPDRISPRAGVLFLHDLDLVTLEGSAVYSALFEKHGLVCVCPQAGTSWWVDRVCPQFDPQLTPERFLLDQAVSYFQREWSLAPRSLGLLGFGMGGQGALRLALRHPSIFQAVAGVGPILDFHEMYHQGTALDEMYDSKEQCRQDTALLHVDPSRFPAHILFCAHRGDGRSWRGSDRLHEKLGALGIEHEFDVGTDGSPGWPYFERQAERAVGFLSESLRQESRRLL